VAQVVVRLLNPENVAVVSGLIATRVSGSAQNGNYTVALQTATAATSGSIYKVQISASDAAGNTSVWTQIGTFTVVVPDTTRPVVVAGSGVVEKASVKFGESFTFTFRATDNIGVVSAHGIIYRPDSYPVIEGGNSPRISGSATDGIYRVTIAIPATVNNGGIQNNPTGTYKVYANVQDAASNSSYDGGYYIYIGTIEVTG